MEVVVIENTKLFLNKVNLHGVAANPNEEGANGSEGKFVEYSCPKEKERKGKEAAQVSVYIEKIFLGEGLEVVEKEAGSHNRKGGEQP